MEITTSYDALPDAALRAIEAHPGLVLLDLDETLYLSNSTEDFIDLARPGIIALLLMRLLDLVKPWRWTGGEQTRDVWRVRAILVFFPWVRRRWRSKVSGLAARFTNHPLLDAARKNPSPPIIVTVGFRSIVEPLIAQIGLSESTIVAARISNFADRRDGKLQLAMHALGADTLRTALIVTDSPQDLPLMEVCASALRVVWPDASFRTALSGVYLPSQYLTRVKRPGERYILRGILQEDFALWILGSTALAVLPLLHVVGLLFLLASFWTIYERGYVDNDQVAEHFEADPKLSSAYWRAPVATPSFAPWLWAAGLGIIAIVLLRWPLSPTPLDFLKWAGVLIGTYAGFYVYNRLDKMTRVWLYGGLQLARSAAFVALVPVTALGAMAIAAHVIARWIPYYIYRYGKNGWPATPVDLTQLFFLLVMFTMLALSRGPAILLQWTALALLLWHLYRARKEILVIVMAATRLRIRKSEAV